MPVLADVCWASASCCWRLYASSVTRHCGLAGRIRSSGGLWACVSCPHFPPMVATRRDSDGPGDARLAWAGVLVAQPVHRVLACRPRFWSVASRLLVACAPHSPPRSLPSMALESRASRLALPSRSWASTINSSASGPSPRRGTCSIAACGATRRAHPNYWETPLCAWGMSWQGHPRGGMAHCPEPGPHDAVADASVGNTLLETASKR